MAKKPAVYEFIPKLGQLRDDVLFGVVWKHKDLRVPNINASAPHYVRYSEQARR